MTELALGTQNTPALSGAGLLGLVTTGMYDAPLSMYREYIQNAADPLARSGLSGRARVDIAIDISERRDQDSRQTVQACPARKRLSGCCPLAAVIRHWESIGASVASGGSPGLPSQRQSHSPHAPARTNR